MENKIYKIYCLKNKKTKQIRYIGVTTNTLSARKSQHKYVAVKNKNYTHVGKWIRKLYSENNDFIIELIEECNYSNWQEREKYWISFYDNLTNIKIGGAGVNLDKEGRNRSIEAHKKKVVILNLDFKLIKRLDSINETCAYLGYVKKATAISNALNGRSKTCKGYILMFEQDYLEKNYHREDYFSKRFKPIYQYSKNKELIKTYRNYKTFCNLHKFSLNSKKSLEILKKQKIYNDSYWSFLGPEIFSKK